MNELENDMAKRKRGLASGNPTFLAAYSDHVLHRRVSSAHFIQNRSPIEHTPQMAAQANSDHPRNSWIDRGHFAPARIIKVKV
jgi:hypothetical protein